MADRTVAEFIVAIIADATLSVWNAGRTIPSVRRQSTVAISLIIACSFATVAGAADDKDNKNKDSDKRPKLTLKAQPLVSMSPSKVTFRAELSGGSNDFEEYYCPTVEWDWGDGTHSEMTSDCDPYERGKSEIRRRYSVEHTFRGGAYQITFRLKRRDKVVASTTASIQVQAGVDELQR